MSGEAAERLHPALVHHLIGTLRWTQLRPLQEQAIDPLLSGAHALLGAPTAAGKTEAAMLPLLSRMASEQWSGLSVLYLCPLRALLNNLAPRIEGLCALLGRRAALWHGDVGDSARRRILADPPDVLLTTPESVEAMFLSRQVDAVMLLGGVRAVVVDEIHAFAGDDRGWHMLALLCRVDALRRAGTEDGGEVTTAAQRVGLTATVGNPEALLDWLCVGAPGERAVVMATDEGLAPPELEVDWVGSLDNAAEVITRLHRGEKRLVFADSRARVEELGAALRARKVTTFVSHSSLSADDRRQAERAFTESRDCVIVATSTLELGIDVGDLDRVIQLGAPRTVASVLQRVGRTGRRGAVRNCLFLATSDIELLTALALVDLLRQGWVEPLRPPAYPVALAAQQLLTRVLADGRLGRSEWPGSFGPVAEAARLDYAVLQGVLRHMVERGILLEEGGVLQIGVEGERLFGRRHFIDLASMFLSEPLFGVRWGQRMLGHIDPSSLTSRGAATPTILLGGTSWGVRNIDWEQRVAWVEPSDEPGRSRWSGAGGTLSLEVCQAIRGVLAGDKNPGWCSRRAVRQVVKLREEYWFTRDGITSAEQLPDRTRTRWWTWAGGRANSELAWRLASEGSQIVSADDLSVTLAGLAEGSELRKKAAAARKPGPQIEPHRLRAIKFNASVPVDALETMCRIRDGDAEAIRQVLDEPAESANRQSR